MDFLNKNQKVYIGEEEKKVFLEKLKRDVEVMIGVLGEVALFRLFPFGLLSLHSQYEGPSSLPFIIWVLCMWGVGYETWKPPSGDSWRGWLDELKGSY